MFYELENSIENLVNCLNFSKTPLKIETRLEFSILSEFSLHKA